MLLGLFAPRKLGAQVSEAGAPARKTAKERAADARITLAVAQARQRRAEAAAEYEAETKGLYFTKDFNGALEATMRDRTATHGERYMAWLKRYSWGEYSLYAIGLDGFPLLQEDAATHLGIDKRRISSVVNFLEARGYVRREGKKQFPVFAPELSVPDPQPRSKAFEAFMDTWRVAHSTDYAELEVARSTVRRIRKVILSEYKLSIEQAKKAEASLYRSQDVDQTPGSAQVLTPYEESEQRRPKKETQRAKPRSHEEEMHFRCRERLFGEIRRMQLAYPHTSFAADPIDELNPDHQALVSLILKKLGAYDPDYLTGYLLWVVANFKGLGGGDLRRKRHPGSESGPKSLGLLVGWAEDYDRAAGGAANKRAQAAEDRRETETAERDEAKRETAWRAACPAGAKLYDEFMRGAGAEWVDHAPNCAACAPWMRASASG